MNKNINGLACKTYISKKSAYTKYIYTNTIATEFI